MKSNCSLFILCFFLCWSASAQNGDYLLTHYFPNNGSLDNDNIAITQVKTGEMIMANRKGVLAFNGKNWRLLPTPAATEVLLFDSAYNTVWTGCYDEIGFIENNELLESKYNSIIDSSFHSGHAFQMVLHKDYLFALTDEEMLRVSRKDHQLDTVWHSEYKDSIYHMISWDNRLLGVSDNNYLYEYYEGNFEQLELSIPDSSLVVVSLETPTGNLLMGTAENHLYYFYGNSFEQIELDDQEYLDQAHLEGAIALDKNRIAVSTLLGGVMIIDLTTGETESFINYHNGLPDDEVYAMAKDKEGALWIAHEYGLSRALLEVPVAVYSNFPGLNGKINTAQEFQGSIFVGTNLGLFQLKEIKQMIKEERVVKVKQQRKVTPTSTAVQTKASGKQEDQASEEVDITTLSKKEQRKLRREQKRADKKDKKKPISLFGKKDDETNAKRESGNISAKKEKESFLDKLFKNDKKKKGQKTSEEEKEVYKTFYKYVTQTEVSVASIKYVYHEVTSIAHKTTQLLPMDSFLIVNTSDGLYATDTSGVAKRLLVAKISMLYKTENNRSLLVATEDNRLWEISRSEGKWVRKILLDNLEFPVLGINEDRYKTIWLSTGNQLISVFKSGEGYEIQHQVPLHNPYLDPVALINFNHKMYCVLTSGIYYFDETQLKLVQDTHLEKKVSFKGDYMSFQDDIVWVFSGKSWSCMSELVPEDLNLAHLRNINDLKDIKLNASGDYFWITNRKGQLFKYSHQETKSTKLNTYQLNLVKAEVNKKRIDPSEIVLGQLQSDVWMHVGLTDFIRNGQLVTFQHKLEGLSNAKWSEWSESNEISYGFLPPGSYLLKIKAKNSYDNISDVLEIPIKVTPPYWKEPWFYATETCFFAFLMVLSFYMNRGKNFGRRWIYVTRGLTFLTLILIVSFIETVVQSFIEIESTPVYDFMAQALLATLIMPFEKLLTKFIAKEK